MKNNNFYNSHTSGRVSPVKRSLSILEVREDVTEQIEAECFYSDEMPLVNEIALIIAEIYCLPSDLLVKINGNDLFAEMVAEVYRLLTHEHINFVIGNFKKIPYQIKSKKTYLRTALYNSVFEFEADTANFVGILNGGAK